MGAQERWFCPRTCSWVRWPDQLQVLPQRNQFYYIHRQTGVTTWTVPTGPPSPEAIQEAAQQKQKQESKGRMDWKTMGIPQKRARWTPRHTAAALLFATVGFIALVQLLNRADFLH